MKIRVAALLFIACQLIFTAPISAQDPRYQRYQPSTPTVSPYLNLVRPEGGVVPNYYSYVRPMQRQTQINRQQQQAINLQEAQTRVLGQQLLEVQEPSVRPTGVAGTYMNYLHFYAK